MAEAERTIAELRGSDVKFENAVEGISYDVLLAVCGCLSRCLDVSQFNTEKIVYIYEEGGAAAAAERIIAS